MTLLAAVSQVKCAAATIILTPACPNASATKCCCQPRGLISLARVPLIITCHYQFWLHLLTRLSVAGWLCMCVYCTSASVSDSGLVSVCFGSRTQPNVISRHKGFISSDSLRHLYIYMHIYGGRQEWITHRSLLLGVCETPLVKVAVDCSQDNCVSGTDLSAVRLYRCIVKAEGSRVS